MDERTTRETGRLTALKVTRLRRKPGMHADGDGLYLQGNPGGGSWILRYMHRGRARYMGLGPASTFSLKDARIRAQDQRRLLHNGIDPIEA
ncbi:MAG: Arm DNA-binding domain-containing protein, partial [Stellaceae bacterium]